MNEIAKFVAIICVLYASYVLCEKCESNPSNGFCELLKRWRNALLQKADANEFLTAMVLFVMIEREGEFLDEELQDDLPEIEEDEIHEIHVEEDILASDEDCPNDNEAIADNELHPKLVPLVLSLISLMVTSILVFSLKVHSLMSSDEKRAINNTWSHSRQHGAMH